jgi:hypothetical protein
MPLLIEGLDIEGSDVSADMIALAEAQVKRVGLPSRLLRRVYGHLEPGGALVIANHEFPYANGDEKGWARWLPGHRELIPRDWPAEGDRRTTSDGDEIELSSRLAELDPLAQCHTLEMRARLWHEGRVVKEESYTLKESLYFAQEILLMLDEAGFREVAIESYFSGQPATADDAVVTVIALK